MVDTTEHREVSYPTTLYFQHSDGRMLNQVFDDPVSYESARQAGWHASPADFGVETHPSQPGLAAAMEPSVMASPAAVDLSELTALLLSIQVQHEQTAQAVRQLTERVHQLEMMGQAHEAAPHAPHVARTGHMGTEDDKPSAPGRK